jgi:c-src tyrosine kinase
VAGNSKDCQKWDFYSCPSTMVLGMEGCNPTNKKKCGLTEWILYICITSPFLFQPLADVMVHVDRGYRMEEPDGCPHDIYLVMRSCWDASPNIRPRFSEMLQKFEQLHAQLT